MPWVEYSTVVLDLTAALAGVGAVTPLDWMNWNGGARYATDPSLLSTAPVADAVRTATAVVRGDRFSEGTIAEALDSGLLLAVADRLLAWHAAG